MKKFILFALMLAAVMICEPGFARQTWVRQNSGTSNQLNAVYFTDANTGTVVGDLGTIRRTTNGGQSWILQNSRTNNINLRDVFFTNANNGIIVGRSGTVLYTRNGGALWGVHQINGLFAELNGVHFITDSIGTAAGSIGNIWRSTTGGRTWSVQLSAQILDNLNEVAYGTNQVGIAVGGTGAVYRTANQGVSWILTRMTATNNLYGVSFGDANTVWAVGQGGIIWRSTNAGQTWVRQNSGVLVDLNDVFAVNANFAVAVGANGTIIRTTDGGQSWNRDLSNTLVNLLGVHFSNINTGTVVGSGGTILRFGPCTSSISPTSRSIAASGGSGSVTVSSLTGCTWTASSNVNWITLTSGSSGSGNGVVNYSVTVNPSTISRTGTLTIAGRTFTVTQSANVCNYSISPMSQSFAANGGKSSVNVTAASGCNWTAVSNVNWITIALGGSGSGNGMVNYSVAANTSTSSRTGTLTIAGRIFTATQAGFSGTYWTNDTFDALSLGSLHGKNGWLTVTGSSPANVVLNPSGAGKVVDLKAPAGGKVSMSKTINTALSGTQTLELKVRVEQPNSPSMAKLEVNTNNGTFWNKKFQIYFGSSMRLNNSPSTAVDFLLQTVPQQWYTVKVVFNLSTNVLDLYLNDVLVLNNIIIGAGPINAIAVTGFSTSPNYVLVDDILGYSGGLVKAKDRDAAAEPAEMPASFDLVQNYPNPFNPETTIQFAVPAKSLAGGSVHVTLRIYNLHGQLVRTLVNEQKSAGHHRVVWDGNNDTGAKISSGVYLYTVNAGDFKATKRMTMLK